MMMKLRNAQQGFTIIELMIATLIFTMVLLVCSYAIIHVGRIYYKGVITNRTQDLSRKVVDELTQVVQFGSGIGTVPITKSRGYPTASPTVTVKSLCLGDIRYSYVDNRSMGGAADQTRHLLWRDTTNDKIACIPLELSRDDPDTTPGANSRGDGVELLGQSMRVPLLSVQPTANGVWDIQVRIAYGITTDLFEDGVSAGMCKGVIAGGQFCAISGINTTVQRRLTE